MRTDFSLSKSKAKVFPETVKSGDGKTFAINANFRTILKILRIQEDGELIENHKLAMMLRIFYKEDLPVDLAEALELMYDFVSEASANETVHGNEKQEQQFDYEFDAKESYKGERYTKLSRAKRKVQLPQKYSREEALAITSMLEKLKS